MSDNDDSPESSGDSDGNSRNARVATPAISTPLKSSLRVKEAHVDSTPKKIISRDDEELHADLKIALGRFSDAGKALWLSQTQHEENICRETAILADFARSSPNQISFMDIYMLAVSDWLKYSQNEQLDLYEWAKVLTGTKVRVDDYSIFFPLSFIAFIEVVCLTVSFIYYPADINASTTQRDASRAAAAPITQGGASGAFAAPTQGGTSGAAASSKAQVPQMQEESSRAAVAPQSIGATDIKAAFESKMKKQRRSYKVLVSSFLCLIQSVAGDVDGVMEVWIALMFYILQFT